ncbi:MAG: ACT domain-containing protein [Chloroflexota bacterium]
MKAKQVSVFLENRPGRLMEMLKVFAENGIDIRALSIADTTDFGIARMVLSDTNRALLALAENGFTASTTDVLQVNVPDKPGGLLEAVAMPLAREGINVEYVYAFVESPQEAARVVLKVSDMNRAEEILGS